MDAPEHNYLPYWSQKLPKTSCQANDNAFVVKKGMSQNKIADNISNLQMS